MHRLFGKKKEAGPVVPPPSLEDTIGRADARTSALDAKVGAGWGRVGRRACVGRRVALPWGFPGGERGGVRSPYLRPPPTPLYPLRHGKP